MTLIKTRARGLKLDDTFAFTGTVSGAGDPADVKLLATTTVSSGVASVDFVHGTNSVVFDSTYSVYKVFGVGLNVQTAGAEIFGQVTDGSSFKTSGYRSATQQTYYNGSSSGEAVQAQTDGIEILRNLDSNATETCGFELTIYEPYTNSYQVMNSISAGRDNATTANIYLETSACFYNANIIATGVRLIPNSGNITGGVFKLYGIK
jgi:hypothetical protein